MADDCFDKVRELIDKEVLKNDRLTFHLDQINELRYDKNGNLDLEAFPEKFAEYLKDFNERTKSFKVQKAENIQKIRQNEVLATQYPGKPGDFIRSRTSFAFNNTFSGEAGSDVRHHANRNRINAYLENSMKQEDVLGLFEKKQFQKEAAQAVSILESGKELPKDFNNHAGKIARIIIGANNIVWNQMRDAGLVIGKQVGYIMPQSHDPVSLKSAGFENWFSDIKEKIDTRKTFDKISMTDKDLKVALKDVYDKITGVTKERDEVGRTSDKLIGVSVSEIDALYKKERSLYFKDGGEFYDYNEKYGRYGMYEGFLRNIDKSTRTAALVKNFGSNPEQMLEGMISRLKRQYIGDEKATANLNSNVNLARAEFRDIRGYGDDPGSQIIAKASYAARAVQSAALLSNLVLNSMSSPINMFNYVRARNGMGMGEAATSLFSSYLKNATRGDRLQYSNLFHIYVGDSIDHLASKFNEEGGSWLSGGMSRVAKTMFRWTGVYDQTQIFRLGSVRMLTVDAAENAAKPMEALNPRFASSLQKSGIASADWEFLRKSAREEFDGNKHITPEGILNMSDSDARKIISQENIKGFTSVDQYKRYSAGLWGDYLTKASEITSHLSGARQNAYLYRGNSPGDAVGGVLRVATQFLQYPLKQIDLTRKIAFSNPELSGNVGLRKIDYQMVASAVAFSTMGGFLINKAKEELYGTKPKPFAQELAAAFVRGGSGGIYGDFLLHDYSRHPGELLNKFAGPTFSQIPDVAKSVSEAVNGNFPKAKKDAFNVFIRNTPMQNFVLKKRIFDTQIGKSMQDLMNHMTEGGD